MNIKLYVVLMIVMMQSPAFCMNVVVKEKREMSELLRDYLHAVDQYRAATTLVDELKKRRDGECARASASERDKLIKAYVQEIKKPLIYKGVCERKVAYLLKTIVENKGEIPIEQSRDEPLCLFVRSELQYLSIYGYLDKLNRLKAKKMKLGVD